MKKFLISWETCYCEDYPEESGAYVVEAENEEEARKGFNHFHAIISNIKEI